MGITETDQVKVTITENQFESQVIEKLIISSNEQNNDNNTKCSQNVNVNIDFNSKQPKKNLKQPKSFTIFGYHLSQIKWFNVIWLMFIHSLAVIGYVYLSLYPVKFWSVWWTILLALFGGFGVSVGAHRLWAHKSFKARWLLRFALVFIETFSMNGGCYSYARDHRCHHKFVDTNGDPKNAKRGFFFAHIGWWMLKKHPEVLRQGKKLNNQDLDEEPLIVWQKRLYFPLFLLFGVVLATLVPYYCWNEDIWVAFFIAAVLRTVVVMHHLFTVNSIAHIWGLRPYNTTIGPTESKLTMYLSMGEGSHNYHHTFPMDYANCQKKWWEVFNPSTLFVDVCSIIWLAYDLKKPSTEVVKGVVSRKGDQNFYQHKLLRQKPLRVRILKGVQDWAMGIFVAGWAIYPPILFKIITGRPLFFF